MSLQRKIRRLRFSGRTRRSPALCYLGAVGDEKGRGSNWGREKKLAIVERIRNTKHLNASRDSDLKPTLDDESFLNCTALLIGDPAYVRRYVSEGRLTYSFDPSLYLPMDCASIRERHAFPGEPASQEEAE